MNDQPMLTEIELERRYLELRLEEELGGDQMSNPHPRAFGSQRARPRPVDRGTTSRFGAGSPAWWVAAAMILLGSGIVIALTRSAPARNSDDRNHADQRTPQIESFGPEDLGQLVGFLRGITRVEFCPLELTDRRVVVDSQLLQSVAVTSAAELEPWQRWVPSLERELPSPAALQAVAPGRAPDASLGGAIEGARGGDHERAREPGFEPPPDDPAPEVAELSDAAKNRILIHGADRKLLVGWFEQGSNPRLHLARLGPLLLEASLASRIHDHLAEATKRSEIAHGLVRDNDQLRPGNARSLPPDQKQLVLLEPDADTSALLRGFSEVRRLVLHLPEDIEQAELFRAILALPRLTDLELQLGNSDFPGTAARAALATAQRIERLVLAGDGNVGVPPGPSLPVGIKSLVLRELEFAPGTVADLLRSVRLQALRFDQCILRSETVCTELREQSELRELAIVAPFEVPTGTIDLAPLPRSLTELRLEGHGEGGLGLVALRNFPSLRALHLDGSAILRPELLALAKCEALTELSLRGCVLANEALASLPKLPHLLRLDLAHCTGLDDTAAIEIADCSALRWLSIEGTGITKLGLRILAKASAVTTLHAGQLENLEPGAHGEPGVLSVLGVLSAMRSLRELSLRGSPEVRDSDLAELGKLEHLEVLDLRDCPGVSAARLAALRASLPACTVDSGFSAR